MSLRAPIILAVIMLLVVSFSGCCCCCLPEEVDTPMSPVPVGLTLPESRPFYMGTTPFPYDISDEAVTYTFDFMDRHTDIVAEHFDDGVPWPEAYAGQPYDKAYVDELNGRKAAIKPGDKVYLAMTPIAITRDGLAPYRGTKGDMELPAEWKGKQFDDPMVVSAYIAHCKRMIGLFEPDYVAYGIEANLLAKLDPEEFEHYLNMTRQVYPALKSAYPGLPLFLTIQIDEYRNDETKNGGVIKSLLPYTDYFAVSTYPFSYMANADELPDDWFSRARALAPDKPFAVGETTFIAEDLYAPGGKLEGGESWQSNYTRFLLEECDSLDAEFVIWFVPRDYDAMWEKIKGTAPDFAILWKDSGLAAGDGKPRQALGVWDAWLALPVR